MPLSCQLLSLQSSVFLAFLWLRRDNLCVVFCLDWSNHVVSKKKYHMIIPKDDCWTKPLNDSILEDTTHLLHGMIHCDGIGHLLCINGLKGGSKHFCGREIMDLWDRICTNLRTR